MAYELPHTLKQIKRARYTLVQRRPCKLCRETVEHWKTTHGRDIYFDAMTKENDEAVPHRSTCKVLEQERQEQLRARQPIHQFAAAAVVIVVDANSNVDWSLANDCLSDPAEIHAVISKAAEDVSVALSNRFNQEGR